MPRSSGLSLVLLSALLLSIDGLGDAAQAQICIPSDPYGYQPGNLCPTFPPAGVSPSDFREGTGKPALYGPALSPTQAGRVVGTTTGYWTGIQAINGETTIRDSKGQVIMVSP